jgi:hypothetical protein
MIYNVSMAFVTKRLLSILAIVLALGFGVGCELSSGNDDEDGVYSYNLDEMYQGVFNSPSHAMALNDWYRQARFWENRSFDQWSQSEEKYLYKEKELQTRFTGSDMVNEDTIVYCDFADFHWAGKKIGDITGTITLTNIFSPTPKVWIRRYKEGEPWWFVGKINISKVTGTEATLDWSIPVYELYFNPPVESRFALFVLPNGSKSDYGYDVPIPIVKTINANTNVGNLGTVSIKGVAVSGTLSVTYNGKPVPYVELLIVRQAGRDIQMASFSSPGPDTPWSVILESVDYQRYVEFKIFGYSKENPTAGDIIIDTTANIPARNVTNQDISGLVLDFGNWGE